MASIGYYVTGTDTGIGKTQASVALLHALRARGLRAVGMKPVASGCMASADGWRNEDALALQAASDPRPVYADVNPFALPLPLAPELAARDVGVHVTLAPLLAAHARLATAADALVVEGVGGWDAPLARGIEQADLVRALGVPVVLVVGLRLGCLSHARLTQRALRADGMVVAGWIGNAIDPAMERAADVLAMLADYLESPCWGVLPHQARPDPAVQAGHLRLPAWPANTSGTRGSSG
jgi:dethiobiotin synthetase